MEGFNDAILSGNYANISDEMEELRAMRTMAVEDGFVVAEALRDQVNDLIDQAGYCQNALDANGPDSLTEQIRALARPILDRMSEEMEKKERANTAFGKPPVITVISDLEFALTALDGEGFNQKRLKDVEFTVACWNDPTKTKTVKTDENGKVVLFAADFMPNEYGVMFLHVTYDARNATWEGETVDYGYRDLGCVLVERGNIFNLQMTSSPIYFSKILYNDKWDMLTVHNGMYIHPEYDDIGTISMDIAQNGQPVRVTGYYPNKDGGIGEIVFTFDLPKPVKTDDRGMTHYEIKHNFLQTGKPGAFRPDERMRFRIAPLAVGENGQNDAAWDAHGMFVNPKAYWVYDKDMKGQPLSDTRSLADKLFGASGAVFPSDIPVLGGLTATLPSIEIFKHTKMFIAMQPDGSVHVSTSTRFLKKQWRKWA